MTDRKGGHESRCGGKDRWRKLTFPKGCIWGRKRKETRQKPTRRSIGRQRGCRRKEKERVRDETEEEGYITGSKAGDSPRTEKEAQVGQARLVEISCADLVWKIRIVTSFISSSVLANRSVGFKLSRSLVSVRAFCEAAYRHVRTHLIFPNPVPRPPLPLVTHKVNLVAVNLVLLPFGGYRHQTL
jgi:hypothetical protein